MDNLRAKFRDDQRGIAAVEFAFIAPVFIFLTTAAIDLGYIQWGRSQLSGASQVAGRAIIQSKNAAGAQRTTEERRTVFTGTITTAMASFPKPIGQNVNVAIKKFTSFSRMAPEPYTDGSRDPNRNGIIDPNERNDRYDVGETYEDLNGNGAWDDKMDVSNDLGGIGDIVKVDVTYPLRPLFSYNAALFGTNGVITIQSSAMFRNEPE